MRKKATKVSHTQKGVSATPTESVSQPRYPRDRKKKPKDAWVYTSHGEYASGAGEPRPNNYSKGKKQQPKAAGYGKIQCNLCSANHHVFQCQQFLDMSVKQRRDHTQGASLFFNCLRAGHTAKECQSTYRCRVCKKTHNTLLHIETTTAAVAPVTVSHVICHMEGAKEATPTATPPPPEKERLLMTCQVYLTTAGGKRIQARAMLDSGAAISVMSSRLMNQLQLPKSKEYIKVSGVESQPDSPPRPTANISVSSVSTGWSAAVKVVVLPKVTVDLPRHDLTAVKNLPHQQGLALADPYFHQPRRVDLILDSDVFDEILLPNKIEGPPATPSAWETKLGWGIMGRYLVSLPNPPSNSTVNFTMESPVTEESLDQMIERYWIQEEVSRGTPSFTTEELMVLKHYESTHYFSSSMGRYVVFLPKKTTTQQLGQSLLTATTRFLRNETAIIKKGTWQKFQSVIQEYLDLGHAQKTTPKDLCTPVTQTFYLPMHAVYKGSSSTTKLRVVFDGSCPTSSGSSLNNILSTGPTLHKNLDQILIRFRTYKVAVSADISKMFREVLLAEPDRQMHRFVWRSQTDQPVETYNMTRVTFGVRPSPFLAVRSLQQAAVDFGSPSSTEVYHINNSFYVDDLLAGADDVGSVKTLYQELRKLLLKAGFDLKVLESIPAELQEPLPQQQMVDHHTHQYPKTLGIAWNSHQDVLAAQVQLPEEYISTKRGVISDTSKSFDVLGWLAPFIINMKVLFQSLWKKGIGWDEPLEGSLKEKHREWRQQLSGVTLPRCYFSEGTVTSLQLHGFADASTIACAAVVYLRATYQDGTVTSRLVVAKTKVAPLKAVSIPRLELCAAVMVAELLSTTQHSLNLPDVDLWAWSDNTAALAWLRETAITHKTYVANRVATAARNVSPSAWLHVPTADNPADCASRGISAQELKEHRLWWGGPPWLLQEPLLIPPQPGEEELERHRRLEAKPQTVYTITAVVDTGWQQKFHCYRKLLNVTAHVFRFYRMLKALAQGQQPERHPTLSPAQVAEAEVILFKQSQSRFFSAEIKMLEKATPTTTPPMKKDSQLRLVQPMLGDQGLLLVGGRLERSNLSTLQKHPVILSSKDFVTRLLFQYQHQRLKYCGPTLLLAHVGQMVYVSGAKRLAKEVCQGCLFCKRIAPRCHQQKMGQLPPPRVEISLCFVHTGLDYAGPFLLKTGHPRRPIPVKGYLAVFVCLMTKGIHLEVVSSKTTLAFVATLKRFVSRRNNPSHIYSDNGSNFVGANNQLKELYHFLSLPDTQDAAKSFLLENRVQWHFIPDRAPHFGGIWEAGVKAAKHCLKRTIGNVMLSFEELSTVFCQAESCLNSRPYLPQDSHSPAGEMPLTPGHFLTGRPLRAYPEETEEADLTLTNRWRLCKSMVQNFWEIWQKTYLQQLQKKKEVKSGIVHSLMSNQETW